MLVRPRSAGITGTGVACCPLSNGLLSLSPGWHAFPIHKAQRAGVRVGMGTDVAGGYASSLLSACRHAVVASKHDHDAKDVDYKDAFWAATLGGARALGLESVLGNFEVGKQFDACKIVCDNGAYDTFPECIPACTGRLEHDFEKFVNLGDDRNVAAVWTQGVLRVDNASKNSKTLVPAVSSMSATAFGVCAD